MHKIRKTNGLAITTSFPQWVGDPLSATNRFLCRCGNTSYLGKRTHHPSWSTRLAIQGMVANDNRSMPAEPDLWGPATSFWAHPGIPDMWPFSWILDGLMGSPKLWFTLCVPIHTERLWSLLLWYRVQGIHDAKLPSYLQTTEADKLRVPKITLGTYSWINKGHFPVRL